MPACANQKLPVVEHVVANQVVEKLDDRLLEHRAFFVQLLNGVGETVRHLYIASF
jgi:hypothetical protein